MHSDLPRKGTKIIAVAATAFGRVVIIAVRLSY
jgi:hypothetical protein